MIWFPHFPPKRLQDSRVQSSEFTKAQQGWGSATAPEEKVEINNIKAFYLLRQLQRDACTRIHQRSHICSAQHLRKRPSRSHRSSSCWLKFRPEDSQRLSKLISRKSQACSWAVCRQASQTTRKREMKSKCLPWRRIACLRSPPAALMQKQTAAPYQTRASGHTFHPQDNSHSCQLWTLSPSFAPELQSWRQSGCQVCKESSCAVFCDAPTCVWRRWLNEQPGVISSPP